MDIYFHLLNDLVIFQNYQKICRCFFTCLPSSSSNGNILLILQIDENTPADAYFTSSVGVTKSDGTYISLAGMTSNFCECPAAMREGFGSTRPGKE